MIKKVKLSSIVINYKFTVRCFDNGVDSVHVNRYRRAIRSGEEFPLMVICKRTNQLLDGFHRYSAYFAELGPGGMVKVRFVDAKTDGERIQIGLDENMKNGQTLSGRDILNAISKLRSEGVPDEKIARSVHMAVVEMQRKFNARRAFVLRDGAEVQRKSGREATVKRSDGTEDEIILKSTFSHLSGKTLTEAQNAPFKGFNMVNPTHYPHSVRKMLENDTAPVTVAFIDELRLLLKAIKKWLSEVEVTDA